MPFLKSLIIFMPLLWRGRRMPKKLFVWHWWFSFPQSCQLATPKYKLVLPSPMAGCLLGKNKQTDHIVSDVPKYTIFLKSRSTLLQSWEGVCHWEKVNITFGIRLTWVASSTMFIHKLFLPSFSWLGNLRTYKKAILSMNTDVVSIDWQYL